jgi:hypothetical protein
VTVTPWSDETAPRDLSYEVLPIHAAASAAMSRSISGSRSADSFSGLSAGWAALSRWSRDHLSNETTEGISYGMDQ